MNRLLKKLFRKKVYYIGRGNRICVGWVVPDSLINEDRLSIWDGSNNKISHTSIRKDSIIGSNLSLTVINNHILSLTR